MALQQRWSLGIERHPQLGLLDADLEGAQRLLGRAFHHLTRGHLVLREVAEAGDSLGLQLGLNQAASVMGAFWRQCVVLAAQVQRIVVTCE
jgi:hypothetical protein